MLIKVLLVVMVVLILIVIGLWLSIIGQPSIKTNKYHYLLQIEHAIQKTLQTGKIEYIYPYATIPLALSVFNGIKFNRNFNRKIDFTKADIRFESLECEDMMDTLKFRKSVKFHKFDKGMYSFGQDMEEIWYIEESTRKLKRIEVLK